MYVCWIEGALFSMNIHFKEFKGEREQEVHSISIAYIYFQRILGFNGHIHFGLCATNKYFQIIGSIHDLESNFGGVVFLDNLICSM